MSTKEKFTLADLSQFSGSEEFYRHTPKMIFTEGVKYVADNAGAYWLLDIIASVQHLPRVKAEGFQVWNLKRNKTGKGAVVKCDDGNDNVVYTQRIEFTDFPLPEIKLYFADGTVMLPSEY